MIIQDWNNLEKPDNVNILAEPGDIVEEVNGVIFLLQVRNGYNNVVAYRIEKSDKFIVWTLYEYCILLHDKYGIDFVRAEGDKGKYKFLERDFTTKEVRKDKQEKERDVYYVNLKAAREAFELKCQEYEFYYNQNLYLRETDEKLKKKYFDKMFLLVKFAVETALKKRLGKLIRKGAVRPNMVEDVYDFTVGATINIMSRYKKPQGYKIKYLLTTADYAALGILHNPRQKFWDSMISYEALEDYDYCKEK